MKCRKNVCNYFDRVYIPNPGQTWKEQADGRIIVRRVNRGFFHGIAQRCFHRPGISDIMLDGYGSHLWKEMDGNQSVYDIVCKMEEYYPEERDRMLDRVVTFMWTLERYRFIVKIGE